MIDYEAIGRRICIYRKSAGLTQAKLSEKLDVIESYISQVERGRSKVSLQRLNEIAEVLNVDISLLVSDKMTYNNENINPEIHEIIKNWPPDRISLLTAMLSGVSTGIKK